MKTTPILSPAEAPAPTRGARVDLFGPAHKEVRAALAELLGHLATPPSDETTARTLLDALEVVLELVERHAAEEEATWRPACRGRLTLDTFDIGHAQEERLAAELRSLARAAAVARERQRVEAWRALYLHYSVFVGECLVHLAEEERVVQPLLHLTFTDAELRTIGRIA